MANFNKVLLLGNLTRDPQLSYTPNQTAVVDFGLATNRRWTGQDGTQREETCFVDCRAFGRQAENINKYLSKGQLVFVEGRLTFDSWTAQDGTKRSKHRVTVVNSQFLPGTGVPGVGQVRQSDGGQDADSRGARPGRGGTPPDERRAQVEDSTGAKGRPPDGREADDIPF